MYYYIIVLDKGAGFLGSWAGLGWAGGMTMLDSILGSILGYYCCHCVRHLIVSRRSWRCVSVYHMKNAFTWMVHVQYLLYYNAFCSSLCTTFLESTSTCKILIRNYYSTRMSSSPSSYPYDTIIIHSYLLLYLPAYVPTNQRYLTLLYYLLGIICVGHSGCRLVD